jgi:hypothetical protein
MSGRNFETEIHSALELLKRNRVVFATGLSDLEIDGVQKTFGFKFPPDLRALLQTEMPIGFELGQGGSFANWRDGDMAQLQASLDWPFEGLAFDIENNAFWLAEWGSKPTNVRDAIEVAREHFKAAPSLIPIYSHRYLPADPRLPGNPVFSVYQSDIIIYGRDLWDYFRHEFETEEWLHSNLEKGTTEEAFDASLRYIPFWTRLYHQDWLMDG